jgi:hypothetical protein
MTALKEFERRDFSTCIGYYGTLYAGKNRKKKSEKTISH